MRLRKNPKAKEALNNFKELVITSGFDKYKSHWNEVFENKNLPLFVELGTGKGKFISELAKKYKDKANFIGIEAQTEVILQAAKKATLIQSSNLKLLEFNINDIVDLFSANEVDRFYINFCDPWPKKRHSKRRLTHRNFLEKYKMILKPKGEIFLKTDNEKLFEFSLNEFASFNTTFHNITFDLHKSDYKENILTEYEMKFSSQGMKIYRAEFQFN
ncbi:tRNA (guanosine(46)-N7)-methyltransferase TrmB [Selenomonadales bacterium OttesenSCG-928-I06]|nr:tRNA (guanosine(46)-N7)-methyltransferase TrmB [Selenomonadales bacterium OttesenSCG-928-I06]